MEPLRSADPALSVCANWLPNNTECQKIGKFSCKACYLILYCSPTCQRAHWPQHKIDCKSPLISNDWRPGWELRCEMTGEPPAFMGGSSHRPFGGQKYLWGNMPAIDILKLQENEGEHFQGPLNILLAASGDLRNVVKTVTSLPYDYKGPIHATINDKDVDIVARNAIMLLICLAIQDEDRAVDCMLHIWYSALVPKTCIDTVQEGIYHLIDDVSSKIRDKAPDVLLGKTWTFESRSLRLVLTQKQWLAVHEHLQIPKGLSREKASAVRQATVCAPERVDYVERRLFAQKPATRLCMHKFRQDGLLLPFGHPRVAFDTPNPTFFQDSEKWPMKDSSDPLDSWSWSEILDTSSGAASRDIYGKLYRLLKTSLASFHRRLKLLDVDFRLFSLDVQDLPKHLGDLSFARIEVSNITDMYYIGTPLVLYIFSSRLQPPAENPHATLITLYMNAVEETIDEREEVANLHVKSPLLRYMKPCMQPSRTRYDASTLLFAACASLVRNRDKVFDRYVTNHKLVEAAYSLGVAMKEKNSIIEKWPEALKLHPGQPGAQEEFDRLLSSSCTGSERYVEWKRGR